MWDNKWGKWEGEGAAVSVVTMEGTFAYGDNCCNGTQ